MCFPIETAVEKKWEFQGLQCVVTRADLSGRESLMKHRCGYVRVPAGHPWHGKDYDHIDADIHGGLTFAELEPCSHQDGVGFWVGFDCAHAGDSYFAPGDPLPRGFDKFLDRGHYWTLPDVQEETERLAVQVLLAGPMPLDGRRIVLE